MISPRGLNIISLRCFIIVDMYVIQITLPSNLLIYTSIILVHIILTKLTVPVC
jgi:hypothetical protein